MAAEVVEVREVFRGYAAVRLAAVLYVVVVDAARLPSAAHPLLLGIVMMVVVVWTVLALWCYAVPARRRPWVFATDLGLTLVLVLSGPAVLGPAHAGTHLSVVALWLASAAMALTLWVSWVWGTLAALLTAAVDVVATANTDVTTWDGEIGFVLLTGAVGFLVTTLRRSVRERDTVIAEAAAVQERERLARVVHDGVLQVLALVERQAPAFGVRGERLAAAAQEQEIALRRLLLDSDRPPGGQIDTTHTDLAAMLDRHSSPTVTISTPGGQVVVDAERAAEVDQAVSEVLTNVRRHAGPSARAWVLLERDGDELVVSIRDNGVGGERDAFEDAAERGRFGVRHSILGRLRDLGGTAILRTAPGRGVEWELRIPEEVRR
ncbi:MacS family sensor histidine kinase [Desertihabitans aurantiacus]|uniref:MacS family sensor histidine kinase n=1 Tax=Desertihabitans aurantiacus TaxID=2282477 RepID=UPI000DF7D068|nr:ATP-binding protein [Desertihabitans aurantiacus]